MILCLNINNVNPLFAIFSELLMPEDAKRRLYVSVWNDPGHTVNQAPHIQPRLEFMGCMSFGVQHVLSQEKVGSYIYFFIELLLV